MVVIFPTAVCKLQLRFLFFFNSSNSINPFLTTPSKQDMTSSEPMRVCRFSFYGFTFLSFLRINTISNLYPQSIVFSSLCIAYKSLVWCTVRCIYMYVWWILASEKCWEWHLFLTIQSDFFLFILFFGNKFCTNRVEDSIKSKKVHSKILIRFIQKHCPDFKKILCYWINL